MLIEERLHDLGIVMAEAKSRKGLVVGKDGKEIGELEITNVRTRWKPKAGIMVLGTAKVDGKPVTVQHVVAGKKKYWKVTDVSAKPPKGWKEKTVA